jgi:hypothetical protein
MTRTLLTCAACFSIAVACASGGGGALAPEFGDDGGSLVDSGTKRDAAADGAKGTCPANAPSGTCSLPSDQNCGYSGCLSCRCFNGTWQCTAPGCASSPGEVVLRVVDQATDLPVRGPTFSEGGQPILFQCQGAPVDAGPLDAAPDAQDAGVACASWVWFSPPAGIHAIVVSAPGYAPTTVSVENTVTTGGCCGPQGSHVERDVSLTK